MNNDILFYFMWLYGPLFPAILLFALFPKSTVAAEGNNVLNFLGINKFKIGGAFAGYFILLAASRNFIADLTLRDDKMKSEIWTIEGRVNYDVPEKTILVSEIQPHIQPENFLVASDGYFKMEIIVPKNQTGDPEFPQLSFEHPGFDSKTVHLVDYKVQGLENFEPQQDAAHKKITVAKPIILTH